MKTFRFRKVAAVIGAAALALSLAACTPEKEAVPDPHFTVSATIDGVDFNAGQALQFETLTPNQQQVKALVLTNNGDVPAVIDDLEIITTGNLFAGDSVRVEIVSDDGAELEGSVLKPEEVRTGKIVLTTTDNMEAGLNGSATLRFKAVPHETKTK